MRLVSLVTSETESLARVYERQESVESLASSIFLIYYAGLLAGILAREARFGGDTWLSPEL